jgi:hypothetical protein
LQLCQSAAADPGTLADHLIRWGGEAAVELPPAAGLALLMARTS